MPSMPTRPKPMPKRVLCVMDLSVVGRAGLSVVVPVLAACGVQACALPAALFSAHTGGFGVPVRQDEAAFGAEALAHYAREDVHFDAVYIGYLCGEGQFALARRALAQYPEALHVVDPALGDEGKPYQGLAEDSAGQMRGLCWLAGLITPNFTESAMLCGQAPGAARPDEAALCARMDELAEGGRGVLITSVPAAAGGYETLGREAAGHDFAITGNHAPRRFPGTGDSFTAAVLGLLLRGLSLEDAARRATRFVEAAAHATYEAGAPARDGLWLEPFLPMLAGQGP